MSRGCSDQDLRLKEIAKKKEIAIRKRNFAVFMAFGFIYNTMKIKGILDWYFQKITIN